MFPSLSGLAGHRAVALQHERYRSHRAVRALLEHLALTRPLVLVLDDMHWADSASVELLGALLRRPPAAPVLTAFALRPRQTPERLGAALERAHRAAALRKVELGALTPDEARAFLGETSTSPRRQSSTRSAVATLLPGTAGQVSRARGWKRCCTQRLIDRPRDPTRGRCFAERRAHAAVGRRTRRARRSGGCGRSIRARTGGGCGRDVGGWGDGRPRRAPPSRSHSHDRHAAPFSFPTPARPACGVRGDGRRAGGSGPTSGAPRYWPPRGVAAAARAHHVERSARRATSPQSPSCARQAKERHDLRLRAPRSGSVRRCGCFPATAPAQDHVELLLARAGALAAAGHFAESHEAAGVGRTCPDQSTALARASRRHAPRWSASSGATSRPTSGS